MFRKAALALLVSLGGANYIGANEASAVTCYKSGYGTRLGQVICYGSRVHRGKFTCKGSILFYTITGPWVDEGKSSSGLCNSGYTVVSITAEAIG